ncbi:unnamed protein product, partial [Meganyctiphanes norvegica]
PNRIKEFKAGGPKMMKTGRKREIKIRQRMNDVMWWTAVVVVILDRVRPCLASAPIHPLNGLLYLFTFLISVITLVSCLFLCYTAFIIDSNYGPEERLYKNKQLLKIKTE